MKLSPWILLDEIYDVKFCKQSWPVLLETVQFQVLVYLPGITMCWGTEETKKNKKKQKQKQEKKERNM